MDKSPSGAQPVHVMFRVPLFTNPGLPHKNGISLPPLFPYSNDGGVGAPEHPEGRYHSESWSTEDLRLSWFSYPRVLLEAEE